jgi:hypothetical protein
MALKFKAVIKKDGTVVTEVVERGEHLCTEVYKVTNSVGKQLSDEETGPDCDRVNETNVG